MQEAKQIQESGGRATEQAGASGGIKLRKIGKILKEHTIDQPPDSGGVRRPEQNVRAANKRDATRDADGRPRHSSEIKVRCDA